MSSPALFSVIRCFGLLACALLVSCTNCDGATTCTTDAQCDTDGNGYRVCAEDQGVCICADDRGCGEGEFCNPKGSCQKISGCLSNTDCQNQDLFCDVTSSRCLSLTECAGDQCCTLDSHCAFGNVCQEVTKTCVPGCRNNGDCVLGQGCTSGGLGQLGTCGTQCTTDNQCPAQHLCNLGTGACELDTRAPYCLGCNGGVTSDDCGAPGNYCLIDATIATSPPTEFCGGDCFYGQACPSGYSCQDVIIVPPSTPECGVEACINNTCSTSGGACASATDCRFGPPYGDCAQRFDPERAGNCDTAPFATCDDDTDCEGTCILKECRGGEADVLGFCTCTRDADCPNDTCKDGDAAQGIEGHCELSGHRCFADADCSIISCVEGGCLIGKNCAPSNDRSCADLQP